MSRTTVTLRPTGPVYTNGVPAQTFNAGTLRIDPMVPKEDYDAMVKRYVDRTRQVDEQQLELIDRLQVIIEQRRALERCHCQYP